jgi:long-chain acyl-CoA synthetase
VLYEHPGVREAAVAADPVWSSADVAAGASGSGAAGAAIHAFVVPRAGTHVTAEELLAHAKKRLPVHAVPVSVRFVATLPRNTLGKVVRRRLLDPNA